MSRETIIFIIDSAGIAISVAIALFCIRYIVVSLRRGFVYINGKKATVKDEPVGFWLGIVSLLIGVVLFSYPVAKYFFPS